jgi:hypothetical protein
VGAVRHEQFLVAAHGLHAPESLEGAGLEEVVPQGHVKRRRRDAVGDVLRGACGRAASRGEQVAPARLELAGDRDVGRDRARPPGRLAGVSFLDGIEHVAERGAGLQRGHPAGRIAEDADAAVGPGLLLDPADQRLAVAHLETRVRSAARDGARSSSRMPCPASRTKGATASGVGAIGCPVPPHAVRVARMPRGTSDPARGA